MSDEAVTTPSSDDDDDDDDDNSSHRTSLCSVCNKSSSISLYFSSTDDELDATIAEMREDRKIVGKEKEIEPEHSADA